MNYIVYPLNVIFDLLMDPNVINMIGYKQNNPHHCYDLYEHSLKTMELSDLWLPHISYPDPNVLIAALLHDVAKPMCAKEKNGRTVFYGHAEKSSEVAKNILNEYGNRRYFDDEEKATICAYIKHHDDFINFKMPGECTNPKWHKEINDKNTWDYIQSLDEPMLATTYDKLIFTNNLLMLARADAGAQAEHVIIDGKEVDSRERKIARIDNIRKYLYLSWKGEK